MKVTMREHFATQNLFTNSSSCFFFILLATSTPQHNNHCFNAGTLCSSVGLTSEALGTSYSVRLTTSPDSDTASAMYNFIIIRSSQLLLVIWKKWNCLKDLLCDACVFMCSVCMWVSREQKLVHCLCLILVWSMYKIQAAAWPPTWAQYAYC